MKEKGHWLTNIVFGDTKEYFFSDENSLLWNLAKVENQAERTGRLGEMVEKIASNPITHVGIRFAFYDTENYPIKVSGLIKLLKAIQTNGKIGSLDLVYNYNLFCNAGGSSGTRGDIPKEWQERDGLLISQAFAESLRANHNLEHLNLHTTSIPDVVMLAMISALKTLQKLSSLNVSFIFDFYGVTMAGARELINYVIENKSLKEIRALGMHFYESETFFIEILERIIFKRTDITLNVSSGALTSFGDLKVKLFDLLKARPVKCVLPLPDGLVSIILGYYEPDMSGAIVETDTGIVITPLGDAPDSAIIYL